MTIKKAYIEPEIVEQLMRTKVFKLENNKHGGSLFETTDPQGNKYKFNKKIHDYVSNLKITRTFEFENMPFGAHIEFIDYEKLTDNTSKPKIHTKYQSVAHKDNNLKLPLEFGTNMAHNRLQEVVNNLK